MSRTLYVTDLDGTLLNPQGKLTNFTRDTINSLMAQGVLFTYATARSFHSASIVTRGLFIKRPVLLYNGGVMADGATGKILDYQSFTGVVKKQVSGFLEQHNVFPLVYAFINGRETVSYLKEQVTPGMRHYLNNRQGDRRFRPLENSGLLYEGDVFYLTCIGEESELAPVADRVKQSGTVQCTFQRELYRQEYWCEIMPAQVSKANGIKKLKQQLRCDKTIVFGDAINDLPMFLAADKSYAVEHAIDALKRVADGIIAGNESDGVARFIREREKL